MFININMITICFGNPNPCLRHCWWHIATCFSADDTLLLAVSDACLNNFLHAVYQAGLRYGMELHPSKFQLISTSESTKVSAPASDTTVTVASSMVYLGSILTADGSIHRELGRRIGSAKSDFDTLAKVWTHSSLTWKPKLQIYTSLIESKLFYALASCCLTRADERRLDGFQNRCLRKLTGIKSAFISRVSNTTVLQKAQHRAASEILRKRRLIFFGKILRCPPDHPLRACCFVGTTWHPINDFYVRRVGRAKQEWVKQMLGDVLQLFDSVDAASKTAACKFQWSAAISERLGY